MNKLRGKRTLIIGALQILAAVASAAVGVLNGQTDLALAISGVLTIVMRVVTTTPVGQSTESPSHSTARPSGHDAAPDAERATP